MRMKTPRVVLADGMRYRMKCRKVYVLEIFLVFFLIFSTPLGASTDNNSDYQSALEAYNKQDLIQAMSLLEQLVKDKHLPSVVLLAYILDKAEENDRAVTLYEEALEMGSPEAAFGLGGMYLTGEGVEQDYRRAYELIEMAAEQGVVQAMVDMAKNYERGAPELMRDAEKAHHWWKKAAALGDATAKEELSNYPSEAKEQMERTMRGSENTSQGNLK